MNNDKIAILLSCYNSDNHKYNYQTINSIKQQSYTNYKLYVIDDGGKNENTINYIKNNINEFLIIKNESNIGLALSLQKGLQIVNEKYIARIDIGDIMDRNRLEYQLEYIKNNKLSLVGSYVKSFTSSGITYEHILPINNNEIVNNIFKKFVLIHPAIFFNRNDVLAVGGYTNKYKTEDLELYFKLLKKGFKLGNCPNFLTSYITDDNGITNNSVKSMKKSRALLRLKYLIYFFNLKNLLYTVISIIGFLLPLSLYNNINKLYKKSFLYK